MKEIPPLSLSQCASCPRLQITPIVYMSFQDQPASPVEVQLDSGMGHDTYCFGWSVLVHGWVGFILLARLTEP
ncbi:hypothetical protein DSO57_1035487 [Entomophthora muscae]|uniref:Uncharacterized protein n=1 Tax=Entomophthora muscae TaxID=34485 RepID=A0ACC2TY78_9FUNG|nr:hypothetical protein DSO57_1035487 [Entomophthora muscae]